MDVQRVVDHFVDVAGEIGRRVAAVEDRGLSGHRDGQYVLDVAADEVAVDMLTQAGFGVLSEESGLTLDDRELLVVVDPVDGSTNAAAGLPWFATSLCAVDDEGPLAAVVVNLATGTRYEAVRGRGATRDGSPISSSQVESLDQALVALSGLPERNLGWRQFRCYGAAALDLCAVGDGTFDAFADMSVDAHGVWDYLGGLLVCAEAGATVIEAHGRDLILRDPEARRTPIAGATPALAEALAVAAWPSGGAPASIS